MPRLSRECIISEKIDGTNASVAIVADRGQPFKEAICSWHQDGESWSMLAGSRTRWITPKDDNFGFARWVEENQRALMGLGPGHHFGEWWGCGIQRGYGLTEKRWSLFNLSRWCLHSEEPKRIITADQLAEARKAAEMLLSTCRRSAEIFAKSKSQLIVAGSIRGVNVKGLIDLAPEGEDYLGDLKTTSKFSLDGFSRTVADFGYHVQAGLYLGLWNAMFPDDQRKRFKLVWQDSAAPYEVAVTELHADEIAHGHAYAMHLIRKVTDAAQADHWPMAFDSEEPLLIRPSWAAMREEERREEP